MNISSIYSSGDSYGLSEMINQCSKKYSFELKDKLEEIEEHKTMDNELFHKTEFLEILNKTKIKIRDQIKNYQNQPK